MFLPKPLNEKSLSTKVLRLLLVFSLVSIGLLVFPSSSEDFPLGQGRAIHQNGLRVRNLNTSMNYLTIQEAIDAPETLDRHAIFVAAGIYEEHVTVDKALSLVGEDRSTTIIEGNGMGTIVYVTADDVEVRGFTIRRGTVGLWLEDSQNSKIIGNVVRECSYGLRVYHSGSSEVTGNDVQGCAWFGVEIKSSGNCTLRDNVMVDNEYNFGVNGDSLSDFINDIDVSNVVNGKPVHYWINKHNITIDSATFDDLGYLGLVNSTNITVKDLNVQNNKQGILFAFTRNSAISNINARDNWNAIYVAHSSNVSVTDNNANSNFDYGIKIFNSSRCAARGNNVENNGWAGIGLFKSPNSIVEGNAANFNTYDLHVVYTNNSIIAGNSALIKPGSRVRYSIAVYYSHNNLIYHNTFNNSFLFVEAAAVFAPRNSWDNGLEGNYWGFYRGVDADHDGIGDSLYVVGENNVDHHPLMGKFSDFTVTLRGNNYPVSIISNSTISEFQFSPDDGRISFLATGANGTVGFSRIAVPTAFLQDLQGGHLSVLINGEPPVLTREWTDEVNTYFYLSYVNGLSESAISPWLIVVVVSVLLVVSVLVLLALKK